MEQAISLFMNCCGSKKLKRFALYGKHTTYLFLLKHAHKSFFACYALVGDAVAFLAVSFAALRWSCFSALAQVEMEQEAAWALCS